MQPSKQMQIHREQNYLKICENELSIIKTPERLYKVDLEHSQSSKMELSVKVVHNLNPSAVFR